MNKENLTTRVSQKNGGGQLLKAIVKEGRTEKGNDQHYDEVLERCQRETVLLEFLLEESECGGEITIKEIECELLLEGEIEVQEQQINMEEGCVFNGIKEEEKEETKQQLQ